MSINFNDHDITTSGIITAASGYFTTLTINNSNFNSSVSGLLPTISNSGDNRILTSTGSTVGINAESYLTFSDGVLDVGSTGNAIPSQINLYNSDSNDTVVSLRLFDTNNNLMVSIGSNDDSESNDITSSIYPLNITSSETFTLFTSKNLDIYATSGTTLTGGNLRIANQTASTIASFDSNKNVVSLNTSTYPSLTELSYVKGVTSAIQTQIDSKAAISTTITAGSGLAGGGSLAANRTIDIGQGDGISVSADSIAVDSTVIRTTGVQTMSGAKTFTAATVFSTGVTISSSGTNVPLTITNDGTGNSFVVNDVTGDTSPFVIDSSGNVGISTNPSYRLHVAGGGDPLLVLNADNSQTCAMWYQINGSNKWFTYARTTDSAYCIGSPSANPAITVSSTGRVGIGVTPASAGSSALQVRGDLDIFGNGSDRSITYNMGVGDDGITGWYRSKIAFIPSSDTNKVSQHIAFFNKDGDLGASTLTERMRITTDGNVGIGTSSVSSGFKVDIRGRILSYTTASDGLITTQGLQTTSGGTGKAAIQIDVNGKGGFAWQNDASSGTRSLKLIENAGYGASETTLWTVQSGGNTGLGASPSNDYKLVIGGGTRTDSYTTNPSLVAIKDFTNTNTGDNLSSATYSYATTNGNYAIRNVAINTYFKINSGITNSGSSVGIANNNLRNYALTNDIGTLSALYGIYNQYGHYNTSAVSPVTTTAIGIQHILWRATGTITNAFDIYCSDASSGATVTNRWGIYVEHTGKNYFGGNTGVGVSPTYRFEVRGSGATSSTVSFYVSNSSGAALLYTRDDGAINTGTAAVSPYNNTTATAANMVVGSDGFLYRSTSSLRYKTDVNDATHGLNEVLQLKSVTFKSYNDGNTIFGGLIAEEVDKIGLTEFVQYDNENRPDSIHYGNMVSLLIKAIQEQQIMINNLKDRLSILEGN
jgi:hypothetical protein